MILEEKFIKLYLLFAGYPVMIERCSYCYDAEGSEYFQITPVRQISAEKTSELLHETWDHWESTEVLKHYLPRMIEVLFPPYSVPEMYPGHFLSTLNNHNFHRWPQAEKASVIDVLAECKRYFAGYDCEDWQAWDAELEKATA